MSNLLLSILCAVAFVAFSNAKVLSPGPQPLEEVSSPLMPQKLDKRYATQVITLYLTPSEMKALTEGKDTENSEFQIQEEQETQESDVQKDNDQQQLNQYNKLPTPVEEPKAELRGLLTHHSFYPREEKSAYENQQWNYNFANSYSEQKPKNEQKQIIYSGPIKNEPQGNIRYQEERKTQQESALEKESQWTPIVPESAKEDTEQLYEQLKQQGNNIFNQNRVQLKALPTIPKESENTKETNSEYNVAKIIELNSKNVEKSEIEKQIELILRHEQAFEEEKQRSIAQAEANKQRLPIIIHKEVSVTKHLPVPVLRKVKIPTPVLVPIPEPYEVKIPHPYPVPFKVIKHIPVPVIRHY